METEKLKQLQQTELSVLIYIDKICRENGLNYSLIGGTLLGAVRHKGFIPWDDDIDIVMPREDYEKFLELLSVKDDNYYVHYSKTDETYWNSYAKVRLNNTVFIPEEERYIDSHNGVFVDIFPLDSVPKQKSLGQKIQAFRVKLLKSVIIRKKGIITPSTSVLTKAFLHLYKNKTIYALSLKRDKLMKKYNNKACTEYYVNLGSNYNYEKQTMRKNWYFPPKELEFEGHSFFVMNNYLGYLERLFGKNYMELPPVEKRRTHSPYRIEL